MEVLVWASSGLLSLPFLLVALAFALGEKLKISREMSIPFECGFDPGIAPKTKFSTRFFLVAIVFLIFDVEIALLFPLVPSPLLTNNPVWASLGVLFLIILILGTYLEWSNGVLDWEYT